MGSFLSAIQHYGPINPPANSPVRRLLLFLDSFAAWLYATPLSTTIRDVSWIVPAVQSIHILAVTVVVGSAVVCDLRIAGLLATDAPAPALVRRYWPWTWRALVALLLTGLVMATGEPDRVLTNTTFWLKMVLVCIGSGLTWLVCRPFLGPAIDSKTDWQGLLAKPAAWLSLALWGAVIVCGRWIAYSI